MSNAPCQNRVWHKLADGEWHSIIRHPSGEGYYIDNVLHEREPAMDLGPRGLREWLVFKWEYLRADVEYMWRRGRMRLGGAIMPEQNEQNEKDER